MKSYKAALLPVLAATIFGCGEFVAPLAPPPDLSGVVSQLYAATATSDPLLLITRGSGSAYVYLPDGVRLYLQNARGGLRRVGLDALTSGAQVDVWTTGAEYRSAPPQYDARQVVVR